MIYKSELPSVAVSDCYIKENKCFVTLQVVDSISYIRKISVLISGDTAVVRVKKTFFKKLMGNNSFCFSSYNIKKIIIRKWV